MHETSVDSTSISLIRYEPAYRILEVQFKSGEIYQYFDVPARTYRMFQRAPSKGAFLNYYIKNKFHYVRAKNQAA